MNKKLLLACLALFPLSPLFSCQCMLSFRTFCESIGIDSTDKVGLIEVIAWGDLVHTGEEPWNPYLDIVVLDNFKGLSINDTLRIEMANGFNCAADALYFWPGKKYVFNLENYPHWSNPDSLVYSLSGCGRNYLFYESDSVYNRQEGVLHYIQYDTFKSNFLSCYETKNRVEISGRVFALKDEQALESFNFYMNDQLVETDSLGHFEVTQLLALERGLTMDSTSFRKENEARAGITIRDLVQIQRHLLNIEPFPAYWHFVAADIDLSGRVTTLDMIHLRRLLMGLTDRLPSKSWLLIPKQEFYSLPIAQEYFNIISSRTQFLFRIPRWQRSHHPDGYDLWAIKLGDLL